MATTVTTVDVDVDLDATTVPAQARRIGERVGAALSRFANRRMGTDLGNLNAGQTRWADRLGAALGDRFGSRFAERAGRAFGSLGDRMRGILPALRNLDGHLEGLDFRWRDLSHNTRQWTLIIGAVAAALPQLAGLTAAAGAGLLVLGGAIAAVVTGLGAAVAGMVVFMGDIDNLPAALRPARAELDRLGDAFQDLADRIAISAFEGTEDVWRSLTDTVRELTPAFEAIGRAVNRLASSLAKELRPGTKAFRELYGFIEGSADIFERLMRLAGRLGRALLTAFNNPTFQRALEGLLGYLDRLVDDFESFVNSPGFDVWLDRGIRVFGAFGSLLDTTARMLNDLVTEESVGRLIDFIGHVEGFMDGGARDILEFLDELDFFGLLAEGLDRFGEALEPLAGPMADLAAAVNDIIEAGIDTLAPIFEDVAEALAPFVQGLADFMSENPTEIANGLIAITGAILGMKAISGTAGIIGGFITKMDDLVRQVPTWKTGLAGFSAGIVASLTTITSEDQVTLDNFGWNIVTAMLIGFSAGPFGALVAGLTAFVATALKDAMDGGSYALEEFAFQPGDPFYDLIEGWGGMLTGWREGSLIPFFESFPSIINLALDRIVTETANQLGIWTTNWNNTLAGIGIVVQAKLAEMTSGWNNFWTGVRTAVQNGWAFVTLWFTERLAVITSGWNNFWGGLGISVASAWNTVVDNVRNGVNRVIDQINRIKQPLDNFLGALSRLTGGVINIRIPDLPRLPKAAAGMITNGPTIAGEAGPEIVIPLRRPLHMINPEVRDVAAYAQGKLEPVQAGPRVVVEQLNVVEADDAAETANEVVTRLFERAAG